MTPDGYVARAQISTGPTLQQQARRVHAAAACLVWPCNPTRATPKELGSSAARKNTTAPV